MGIDFSGEDAGVPKHFLDYAEVGTVFDKMRGERVAECVGRDGFADTGGKGLALNHIEYGNAAESASAGINESDVVIFGRLRTLVKVGLQGGGGRLPEGNQPFLVTLSRYPDEPFGERNIGKIEAGRFGNPQTGAVKDFKYSLVPQPRPSISRNGLYDCCDLINGKHVRKISAYLGGIHILGRIVRPVPFEGQPAEKGLQG